jgi:hypothetical protein
MIFVLFILKAINQSLPTPGARTVVWRYYKGLQDLFRSYPFQMQSTENRSQMHSRAII